MEYYSATKKNEIMSFAATWIDRDYPPKWSQTEKDIYMTSHMQNLKNDANEIIYKTEMDSDIENKLTVIKKEKGERGINWELGINMYTLLYIK